MFLTSEDFISEFGFAITTSLWMIVGIAAIFAIYLIFSAGFAFLYGLYAKGKQAKGFGSLKTVTFGDESAVVANRVASVLGVLTLFFLWGLATESKLLPFSLPGPFNGTSQFEYTAKNAAGETDKATVTFRVSKQGEEVEKLEAPASSEGFAKDDVAMLLERRSKILRPQNNDEGGKDDGYTITEINGQPIKADDVVTVDGADVLFTKRGSFSIRPAEGMTMEALFLPPPKKSGRHLFSFIMKAIKVFRFGKMCSGR
jgi:taurine transport system permease protein